MARQDAVIRNLKSSKSIIGAALIGFGLLILFRNVTQAVAMVRILLFWGRQADSFGPLATASLAVQHFVQSYLLCAEFLRLLFQVLLSFSGLLVVAMGTIFFS